MPLYMDVHDTGAVSPEDIARIHLQDIEVQGKYGVNFLTYWFDRHRQKANCLVKAPNTDRVREAHDAAHGNLPNEIIEVQEDEVLSFLGRLADRGPEPIDEPGSRTIVFTDIVGSTAFFDEHGDDAGMEMLRSHNRIVRGLLGVHLGREVKHTGDGFMLVFDLPSQAVRFGGDLQGRLHTDLPSTLVRVGMNTGEPVAEDGQLFGSAVTLASRLCDRAEAGTVYLSDVVRGLTSDEGFTFEEVGPVRLKGFSDPVLVHQLVPDGPSPA